MSENVALTCRKLSVDYGSFRALEEVSLLALNDPATGISGGKVSQFLTHPLISAASG